MLNVKNGEETQIQPEFARTCQVNDRNLYVEVYGPHDGDQVILLHHGLGSVNSWRDQYPDFAAHGYRVIIYDRWGYGKSDSRKHFSMPYFEEDLEDLAGLMDLFKIDIATLIGHSDGGTIGLYFAAGYRDRVAGLITVAAHAFVEETMPVGIYGIRQAYLDDADFREKLQKVHGDKTDAVFWGWCKSWMNEKNLNWDMRGELDKITCPTLVIQGMQDEHATPQHARIIAKLIKNAELWLVPEAGHMLQKDLPGLFNRRVLKFLDRDIYHVQ